VPQCAQPLEGYERAGCIFEVFWDEPTLIQPSGVGGSNWSPMSYNPDTGFLYVPGTVRTSAFVRYPPGHVGEPARLRHLAFKKKHRHLVFKITDGPHLRPPF
jgi:hypothetical protein